MIKSLFKKVTCITICLAIVFLAGCSAKESASTEKKDTTQTETTTQVTYKTQATDVTKNETVYVTLNPDGTLKSSIVTDNIHANQGNVYVNDTSPLTDIKNLNGDVNPIVNGQNLTWHMPEQDLYYSGKTDKKPPVNINISYSLDAKQITYDKLAGKNGQVKISITPENICKKSIDINGKSAEIYSPFIVVGGMILPKNNFESVNIQNGRILSDGTKNIAFFVTVPGLEKSLNLTSDTLSKLGIDMPNTCTIETKASDFELSNMFFAVIPLSSINLISSTDTLSGVKKSLGLVSQLEDMIENMDMDQILSLLNNTNINIDEMLSLIEKANDVYSQNKVLLDLLPKYMTEENLTALNKLLADLDKPEVKQAIEILTDEKMVKFFKNLPSIIQDISDVSPILTDLSKDLAKPDVQKALNNLPETIKTIEELKTVLDKNAGTIESVTAILKKLDTKDINKTVALVEELLNNETITQLDDLNINPEDLIERFNAIVKFGNEYKIFTSAPENFSTKVMFVYETTPIKTTETTDEQSETTTQDNESNGLVGWFKNLFK